MPMRTILLLFIWNVIIFASTKSLAFTTIQLNQNRHHSHQHFPKITSTSNFIPSLSSMNQMKMKAQKQANSESDSISPASSSSYSALLSKIGSSTSKVVAGTFFIVLAYQRNSFMLTFFIGSILNGISSKVLKKLLNQDRPTNFDDDNSNTNDNGNMNDSNIYSSSIKIKPSDKGMPSSHAMSLGFIGIYTAIASCTSTNSCIGFLYDAGLGAQILSCIVLALYVAISLIYRVKSQLHTTDQVMVGLSVGTFNGLFWYTLANGNNAIFPTVNMMENVSNTFLPESGIMPVQYLCVPALVGLFVVGSFERRISGWIKKLKSD